MMMLLIMMRIERERLILDTSADSEKEENVEWLRVSLKHAQ